MIIGIAIPADKVSFFEKNIKKAGFEFSTKIYDEYCALIKVETTKDKVRILAKVVSLSKLECDNSN